MSDEMDHLYEAECAFVERVKQGDKEAVDSTSLIDRLRAENERLAAENEHWRKQDDAIRAEFGGKRDGMATIECLREAFAAKWSEEDALFQATLDMKREELRAENERLTAENKSFRKVLTMIAEKHGQCGECGRDAVGDNGGVVDCVDERPDWYLYRSRCWWEPGDPARRARAALEGK